jgi:putative ABC transport system ATP-binding protein
MALLQTLHRERGITVMLVTHNPEIARQTSRIIYLHDRQIVRKASPT